MGDDRLISHLLSEMRQVTDMRIELASMREWRYGIDSRVSLLESNSKSSQELLNQQAKATGVATKLREQAIALVQWISVLIITILSATKMLPPWIEKLVSALGRAS